jgi:hypothetical protein
VEGDAIDVLIASCPSFERPGATEGSTNDDETLGDLAHRVVGLVADGHRRDLEAVLVATEALLERDDAATRQIVVTGFLEDIQNIVSHDDVSASSEDLRPLLGPRTRTAWRELDDLWASVHAELPRAASRSPMDLEAYATITDTGLRRLVQRTFRRMDDSMVGVADVLRFEVKHHIHVHAPRR